MRYELDEAGGFAFPTIVVGRSCPRAGLRLRQQGAISDEIIEYCCGRGGIIEVNKFPSTGSLREHFSLSGCRRGHDGQPRVQVLEDFICDGEITIGYFSSF